jgi:hypothetical protein
MSICLPPDVDDDAIDDSEVIDVASTTTSRSSYAPSSPTTRASREWHRPPTSPAIIRNAFAADRRGDDAKYNDRSRISATARAFIFVISNKPSRARYVNVFHRTDAALVRRWAVAESLFFSSDGDVATTSRDEGWAAFAAGGSSSRGRDGLAHAPVDVILSRILRI